MGSSHDETSHHLKITFDLLQSVGFFISWENSVLFPSQTIEFLGLNIRVLTLSLPPAKVDSIVALCDSLVKTDQVKLRDIAIVFRNFFGRFPRSHLPKAIQDFCNNSISGRCIVIGI